MRRLAMLLLVPVCLLVATPAAAQDRIGLGLGLQQFSVLADDDIGFLTALTPQLYVPIMLNDGLMLEPGIGFFRVSESGEDPFGGGEFSIKASFLRVGAGLLFIVTPSERGRVYAGPRFGILRMSFEDDFDGVESSESRMDLLLSGVAGGEFFLVPSFSLGGEAALHYLRVGDEESDDGVDPPDSDASLISIGTEFRVRWYIR